MNSKQVTKTVTKQSRRTRKKNATTKIRVVFKMVCSLRRLRAQRRNSERLSFVSNEVNESIDKPLECIDWMDEGNGEKRRESRWEGEARGDEWTEDR